MQTHLPNCLYHLTFRRYTPLNLPFSCKVVGNRYTVLGPKFLWGGGSKKFYGSLLLWFTPSGGGGQSLVLSCYLKCVCKAPEYRTTHNFRRVGENAGAVLSRLWIKVHVILRGRRRLLVANTLTQLSMSSLIPKVQAVKVAKSQSKVVFGLEICRGRGYPRFWTRVFKSHLHVLPTMRPDMVEFCSASSEIRGRKQKNPSKA